MAVLILFDGDGTHGDMRTLTNTALNLLNSSKVETVVGKALSTNDFDNTAVAKLLISLTKTDVINTLTSTVVDLPGSANQLRVLKGLNDSVLLILATNDPNLDDFQKITNFVNSTRSSLDNLGIGDVSGLSSALNDAATNSTTVAAAGAVMDSDTSVSFDNIFESTLDNGVLIDGVLIKDGEISSSNITIDRIGSANFTSIQEVHDTFHSSGLLDIDEGVISDGGSGTINITSADVFIRSSVSNTSTLSSALVASVTGLVLVDNLVNYIYVEFNLGVPQFAARTVESNDSQTDIFIGKVFRSGVLLEIATVGRHVVGDHANLMIRRMKALAPFARTLNGGADLAETGVRNFSVSSGSFWQGLNEFTTASFDSSSTGTFNYWHKDGGGGWTKTTSNTQITNTQYDDGTGTLATLSNNKYGVHWVYIDEHSDVNVIYGVGDYTLMEAQDSSALSLVPPEVSVVGRIIGKIIIKKNDVVFSDVLSAFEESFSFSSPTDHGGLVGLLDDDHSQYLLLAGRGGSPQTILGGLEVDDGLSINDSVLDINLALSASSVGISVENDGSPSQIRNEIWSNTPGNSPSIQFKRSSGSKLSPQPVTVDYLLGEFRFFGSYDTLGTPSRQLDFGCMSSEAWDLTSRGTTFFVKGTPLGSTVKNEWFTLRDGKLGLGEPVPSAHLDIKNPTNSLSMKIYRPTTINSNTIAQFASDVTSVGTVHCLINANGDVLNTGGVFGTISDKRVKENITPATPKLSDLMKVKIVNFNIKGSSEKQIGIIADDFMKIFPSLVGEIEEFETVLDTEWTPAPAEFEDRPVIIEKIIKKRKIVQVGGKWVYKLCDENKRYPDFTYEDLYDEKGVKLKSKHKVFKVEKVEIHSGQSEEDRPMIKKPTGKFLKYIKSSVNIPMLIKSFQEMMNNHVFPNEKKIKSLNEELLSVKKEIKEIKKFLKM